MPEPQQPASGLAAGELQASISRIHEACKAPPYSPPEYRALFSIIAQEISENQLQGVKTLENVSRRAEEIGITVGQDEARYVLDAISEADPWFEQGASAALFASRFRNFVVARCRDHGLNLSANELDLIDAWFAGSPKPEAPGVASVPEAAPAQMSEPAKAPSSAATTVPAAPATAPSAGSEWWAHGNHPTPQPDQPGPTSMAMGAPSSAAPPAQQTFAGNADDEDFPRIVRNRLRG